MDPLFFLLLFSHCSLLPHLLEQCVNFQSRLEHSLFLSNSQKILDNEERRGLGLRVIPRYPPDHHYTLFLGKWVDPFKSNPCFLLISGDGRYKPGIGTFHTAFSRYIRCRNVSLKLNKRYSERDRGSHHERNRFPLIGKSGLMRPFCLST